MWVERKPQGEAGRPWGGALPPPPGARGWVVTPHLQCGTNAATASTTATNAASMSSAIAPEPQMAFDGAVAVAQAPSAPVPFLEHFRYLFLYLSLHIMLVVAGGPLKHLKCG